MPLRDRFSRRKPGGDKVAVKVIASNASSLQGPPEETSGLFEFPKRLAQTIATTSQPTGTTKDPSSTSLDQSYAHDIDVVAVHGLGGHWKTTWRAGDDDESPIWLRDRLPVAFDGIGIRARILSYGYDSKTVFSRSVTDIESAARTLLGRLRGSGKQDEHEEAPILFVAHSLGGLIVKQAMILAWTNNNQFGEVLGRIKGCLFLGVPHRGADLAYWAAFPARMIPYTSFGFWGNPRLLKSLRKNSEDWMRISNDFVPRARRLEIRSFFETDKFRDVIVVDKNSATMQLPTEIALPLAGSDHRSICKFGDADNQRYLPVWNAIHELAKIALSDKQVVAYNANSMRQVELVNQPEKQRSERNLSTDMDECLRSLFFPEMDHRINDIANAADNTCIWLSMHPKYVKWFQTRSSLLWIKGKPGAGKSTLMKYAIRRENPDKATIASFFFNGRGSPIEKTPLGLYQSILHQLLPRAPEQLIRLSLDYKERCQTGGEFGKQWNWRQGELEDRLTDLLLTLAVRRPVRVYVDALDESGEDFAIQTVDYFQRLVWRASQAGNALNVCFSCRHYPIIALTCGFEICVEKETGFDIANYVHRRFEDGHVRKEKAQALQEEIIERANGVFQWVVLVVKHIIGQCRKGIRLHKIQEEIMSIPRELNQLYLKVLEDIPDEQKMHSLRLMQWICFALRPLSLEEMRFAIVMNADTPCKSLSECTNNEAYVDTDEEMENRVIDLSGGLAEVKKHKMGNLIQLVHQSVNDYFVEGGIQLLEGVSTGSAIGRAHLCLSWSCIQYLGMDEINSIEMWDYDMSRRTRYKSDIQKLERMYPLIRYATVSWVPHAINAAKQHIPQEDLLEIFCKFHVQPYHRIEHWIHLFHMIDRLSVYCPCERSTVLHVTAQHGLCSVISKFMSRDHIETNSKDDSGQTPLSKAAENGHEAVVKLLLARNDVEANSNDEDGKTPLSWAAEEGQEAVVKLLLARNDVEPDSKDEYGQTPLSLAAEGGHKAVVKLLLARNDVEADPKDKSGQTPLSRAAQGGSEAVVKLLLAGNNVEADSKDNGRHTPLSHAAKGGHEAVVKLLLARNDVEPDSKDEDRHTPLSHAALWGQEAVVKLLLARNDVEADSKDCSEATPLVQAAWAGHEAVVKLLLAHDTTWTNEEIQEALSLAELGDRWTIVKLLESYTPRS